MNTSTVLLNNSFPFLNGSIMYCVLFIIGICTFILAGIIMEYHWHKYGKEIKQIVILRYVFYVGSLTVLSVIAASLYTLL